MFEVLLQLADFHTQQHQLPFEVVQHSELHQLSEQLP
jgi:hypothetical protein